jgi:hypothetical protein
MRPSVEGAPTGLGGSKARWVKAHLGADRPPVVLSNAVPGRLVENPSVGRAAVIDGCGGIRRRVRRRCRRRCDGQKTNRWARFVPPENWA